MGQKDKLIRKQKSKPRDFTFDEAQTLRSICLMSGQIKEGRVDRVSCSQVQNMGLFYCINLIREKNCLSIR